jgi:predicted MarR family transcription regulator
MPACTCHQWHDQGILSDFWTGKLLQIIEDLTRMSTTASNIGVQHIATHREENMPEMEFALKSISIANMRIVINTMAGICRKHRS